MMGIAVESKRYSATLHLIDGSIRRFEHIGKRTDTEKDMGHQNKGKESRTRFAKAASIVFTVALVGALASACQSKPAQQAQEQSKQETPAAESAQSSPSYNLTPAAQLKSLASGATAVFDPYEITIVSADAVDGKTVVSIKVKAHDQAETLTTSSFQAAAGIVDTTFSNGTMQCNANSETSGTVTFGSSSISEINWSAAGCEATWKVPAKQESTPAKPDSSAGQSGSAPSTATAPQAAEPPAPAAQPQTVTVYITNTGNKYHTAGCQYLKKSKIAIDLDSAKAEGYEPCSKCNPPR